MAGEKKVFQWKIRYPLISVLSSSFENSVQHTVWTLILPKFLLKLFDKKLFSSIMFKVRSLALMKLSEGVFGARLMAKSPKDSGKDSCKGADSKKKKDKKKKDMCGRSGYDITRKESC